jgi:hypothetical protein
MSGVAEWRRGTPPLRCRDSEANTDRILERREDQTLLRPERTARREGRKPAEPMLFGMVGMAHPYQRPSRRGIRITTYAQSPT